MNNVFICTTKYQLFNIVNILKSNFADDTNDLYVLNCIADVYKEIAEIAKKISVFSVIKIIDAGKVNSSGESYLNALSRAVFPQKMGIVYKSYDRVFITGTEFYSRLIAAIYLNINKKCDLLFYEDGMGSYTDVLSNRFEIRSNKLLELKYHVSFVDRCKGMFVYKPDYICGNPHDIAVKPIKNLVAGDSYSQFLYEMFTHDISEPNFKENVLFFDAFFTDKTDINESNGLIRLITEIIGDDLVVKPHPSCKELWIGKDTKIFDTNDSFEVNYLMAGMGNKIFISAYSTATLLPKLIFNEEPRVILLYNLYSKFPDVWKNGDKVYRMIQNDYQKKDRFFIPENREQLIDILHHFVLTYDDCGRMR